MDATRDTDLMNFILARTPRSAEAPPVVDRWAALGFSSGLHSPLLKRNLDARFANAPASPLPREFLHDPYSASPAPPTETRFQIYQRTLLLFGILLLLVPLFTLPTLKSILLPRPGQVKGYETSQIPSESPLTLAHLKSPYLQQECVGEAVALVDGECSPQADSNERCCAASFHFLKFNSEGCLCKILLQNEAARNAVDSGCKFLDRCT